MHYGPGANYFGTLTPPCQECSGTKTLLGCCYAIELSYYFGEIYSLLYIYIYIYIPVVVVKFRPLTATQIRGYMGIIQASYWHYMRIVQDVYRKYMVVPKMRGPQYRPQNAIVLIMECRRSRDPVPIVDKRKTARTMTWELGTYSEI